MPNIQINIKNKVARADRAIIVCDNSDYTAVFDFDDEWSAYDTKTARFVYGGKYTDVVFSGNSCPIPEIHDARSLTVGVYAGDLHTTTPAYISCVPSILCGNGIPADPTPDVYNQLMELLNKESGIWYPAVDDAGNMSWTRSMSETEPQPVNIKGPKGDAGADGVGIPGTDGKDGVDGKSAYELAQDNGFVGTTQEWLASLVGADGANGVDGNDGISPAVSVAAITGGNRVTITDAEGAKTFDVMDGAQGASGADGKDYVLTDADKQEIAETAAGLVDVPSVQPDWNQNDSTQPDYIKNRPFYTGNPVETVLVEDSTISFADVGGMYAAQIQSSFAATIGETYKVYWDGTTYECACVDFNDIPVIGNLSIPGAGSDTGEPFVMQVKNGASITIVAADTAASHTFSISRFVSEIVKIDEKYLPDNLATKSEVEVAQTAAENAQTTAEKAQTAANAAQTTAENAQTAANAAQTTAENAQTAANAAQTTAENAQTAANAALERTVEPYTRNAQMAPLYKNGGFLAWRGVVQDILYNKTEGYFFADAFDTTALKEEDIPQDIFCVSAYVGNQNANAFLTKAITSDNSWSVSGFAVITEEYSRSGEVLYVSSNNIPRYEAKGLFLTFRAPDSMLLKSSTGGSDKQFRITVDDSGTITATEVT